MSTLSHWSAARSIPARSVQAALLLCCLVPASTNAEEAVSTRPGDDRGTIVKAAGGRLQFTQRGSELILPTPDGKATTSIELPGKWIVESAARTGETTWISGRSNDIAIDDMFLALLDAEGGVELLPTPAGREHPRGSTGLLVERDRIVGIAWLEGESQETTSVRAAQWTGENWGALEVVAPALGREQTHLDSTVLADGSWLTVWAAVDGDSVPDDDIWWSHRARTGWSQPQRLHLDNHVPDIEPQLAAAGRGALAAWTSFDGSDYRIRITRFEGGKWIERPVSSEKGAIPRSFVLGGDQPALLYDSVIPDSWNLLELANDGRARQRWTYQGTEDEIPLILDAVDGRRAVWPGRDPTSPAIVVDLVPSPEPAPGPTGATPHLAPQPAEAVTGPTFKYLAFGDSITCGRYDNPEVCSGSEPLADPLNLTGYPQQLAAVLPCNSSSCRIYNYGDPGEKTAQGVSRINGILANANGPYDVMILMHGTNNIGNTGNTTIENDLKTMSNSATAAGVDTVFASIIRFDPMGTKHTPQKEDQIADLRSDLMSIAANRGAWFADPWARLCFSENCFANHYTGADNGQRIHPDASGYNELGDKIVEGITQHPAPSPPSLQNPADGADVASSTVTWSTTTNATWYEVEWNANDSQWLGASNCSGGLCSHTILGLGPGEQDWRVRGRNPRGRGGWSETRTFTLYTVPPNQTTPISPTSDIYDGVEPAEFVWDDVDVATNGATRYQLHVERDGMTEYNEDVPESGNCNGIECSFDPGITWTPGSYRWRVRSENPAGVSAWSSPWTEFLFTNVKPATPTPVYPVDTDTFDTMPLFIWTQEFGAEEYEVQIDAESPQTVGACNGTTCSWAPADPHSVGEHSWKVRAQNPIGASYFSGAKNYEILDCTSFPNVVLDMGNSGSTTHHACDTITAEDSYRVDGDLILHAGNRITLRDNFTVAPGGTLHARVDP